MITVPRGDSTPDPLNTQHYIALDGINHLCPHFLCLPMLIRCCGPVLGVTEALYAILLLTPKLLGLKEKISCIFRDILSRYIYGSKRPGYILLKKMVIFNPTLRHGSIKCDTCFLDNFSSLVRIWNQMWGWYCVRASQKPGAEALYSSLSTCLNLNLYSRFSSHLWLTNRRRFRQNHPVQ